MTATPQRRSSKRTSTPSKQMQTPRAFRTPVARTVGAKVARRAVAISKQSAGTPIAVKSPAHQAGDENQENAVVVVNDCQQQVPQWQRLEVKKVLRMHWRADVNDDIDALQPQVWQCQFAPILDSTSDQYLVATCGSNSVCLTDCASGRVVLKYRHVDEPQEEFQCLAWTVTDKQRVLAVAGKAKTVKLINTAQRMCYRYLQGHRGPVNCMRFFRQRPRWLLTGSDDKTIRLTDIGSLTSSDDSQCLAVFDCKYAVMAMSLELPHEQHFLATNQDCAMTDFDLLDVYAINGESVLPLKVDPLMYYDGDGWPASIVDYVQFLNHDTVLMKAYQGEVQLVKYSESSEDEPAVSMRRQWPRSSEAQLGGCVIAGGKWALFGDDLGNIQAYNLTKGSGTKKLLGADVTLSHADSQEPIRCVDVSQDGKYVVAVDDQDCVWIWSASA